VLTGTADPKSLAERAPTLAGFDTAPVRLEGVETFQVFCEMKREGAESLLPPGLHPTLPPVVTWLVQRVAESPWGPFGMAQCRVECRSGLRPRGFLRAGVIDNAEAATELASRWGYALQEGEVTLERGYDRNRARVVLGGKEILDLLHEDPQRLRPEDAYYVANMHLAHTPNGLRLVQVDPDFEIERAERGRAIVRHFDAGAWRSEAIRPSNPVAALLSVGSVTLPALRYICRPDVLAFEGTERVDA
jgi:hypothetical protein